MIVGVVPARAGSERLPDKNMAPLGPEQRPMVEYTICYGTRAKLLDRLYCVSNHAQVLDLAAKQGCVTVEEPDEVASGDRSAVDAVRWFLTQLTPDPDAVVMLLPTSPLRTDEHIDGAISLWQSRDPWAASVVSVVPLHKKALRYERANGWLDELRPPGYYGQAWELCPEPYLSNGAIQIAAPEIVRMHGFWPPKAIPYPMDALTGLDIDTHIDFTIADSFLHNSPRMGIQWSALPVGSES